MFISVSYCQIAMNEHVALHQCTSVDTSSDDTILVARVSDLIITPLVEAYREVQYSTNGGTVNQAVRQRSGKLIVCMT